MLQLSLKRQHRPVYFHGTAGRPLKAETETWVLFILSAHTRPIYPTHFADNLYI